MSFNMSYESKYQKYKKKYLAIKSDNLYGGSIVYDPFSTDKKLLRQKVTMTDNKVSYNPLISPANILTDSQQKEINNFINFIIPQIKTKSGTYFGRDSINKMEVLNAGTFGVTFFYEKYLIKILKINWKNLELVINEILIVLNIFFDANGNMRPNVPKELNQVYGYISANPLLAQALRIKNQQVINLGNDKIYMNYLHIYIF